MEKLKLKNGKEVKLEITYGNLFKFNRERSDVARSDLVALITEKELQRKTATIEQESILQLIYVAYLGGKNEDPIMSLEEFYDSISFDFKRDMKLFAKLTDNKNEKN
ncbi:MAG: hypothetical protein PHG03_00255 [Bacilli bacterium]|nr:hypothetical protein [Bacilli bacterium]